MCMQMQLVSSPDPQFPVYWWSGDETIVSNLEASCYCGGCGKEYQDETEDVEVWIGCDMCESWYCMSCEGLTDPPEVDMYICTKCQ